MSQFSQWYGDFIKKMMNAFSEPMTPELLIEQLDTTTDYMVINSGFMSQDTLITIGNFLLMARDRIDEEYSKAPQIREIRKQFRECCNVLSYMISRYQEVEGHE